MYSIQYYDSTVPQYSSILCTEYVQYCTLYHGILCAHYGFVPGMLYLIDFIVIASVLLRKNLRLSHIIQIVYNAIIQYGCRFTI